MGTPVADDGAVFDLDSVRAEPIRAEQLYDGVRVSALSFIGTARVTIRIDIGFGDAVTLYARYRAANNNTLPETGDDDR